MKIRTGFVSNSSSSSFLLDASLLTIDQIDKIANHIEVAHTLNFDNDGFDLDESDEWDFTKEGDNKIRLYTTMDNFDMEHFLELIKVPPKAILEHEPGGTALFRDF